MDSGEPEGLGEKWVVAARSLKRGAPGACFYKDGGGRRRLVAHEAPRGINGGDRGVLPILGARERATGRRRGGEIWGIQCARPREERGAEKAALTGSTRRRGGGERGFAGEEDAGRRWARGRPMAIGRLGERRWRGGLGAVRFDRTVGREREGGCGMERAGENSAH